MSNGPAPEAQKGLGVDGPSKVSGHLCDWVLGSGWAQDERAQGQPGRGLQVAGGLPVQASHVAPMGAAQSQAAWGRPFLNLGRFIMAVGPWNFWVMSLVPQPPDSFQQLPVGIGSGLGRVTCVSEALRSLCGYSEPALACPTHPGPREEPGI